MPAIMTSRQAAEFDHALERNGWTAEDVKKLSEGSNLKWVHDVLCGHAKVVPSQIVNDVAVDSEKFLRLISGSETLMLDPVDGKRILANAKNTFAWIDSDFKNWKVNKKGVAKGETPVCVYEMVKDGTFAQIFNSLNADLEKLCLQQDQIEDFARKHRGWLKTDGYGTFFLFKPGDSFFVARVYFPSDGELYVYVSKFGYVSLWDAEHRHRFVVPQLA